MGKTKSVLKGIGLIGLATAVIYGITKVTSSQCCECDEDGEEGQESCHKEQKKCGVDQSEENN